MIVELEEAIEHCWEVAVGRGDYECACAECKADHMQLMNWLKELQEYRKRFGKIKW